MLYFWGGKNFLEAIASLEVTISLSQSVCQSVSMSRFCLRSIQTYKIGQNHLGTNPKFHYTLLNQHLPNICSTFAQYLPNIYPIFAQHFHNMFTIVAQFLHNICPIIAQYMPIICPIFCTMFLNICRIFAQYFHYLCPIFAQYSPSI